MDARRRRITISQSEVNWIKWACLYLQAACALSAYLDSPKPAGSQLSSAIAARCRTTLRNDEAANCGGLSAMMSFPQFCGRTAHGRSHPHHLWRGTELYQSAKPQTYRKAHKPTLIVGQIAPRTSKHPHSETGIFIGLSTIRGTAQRVASGVFVREGADQSRRIVST
jgi:hypothetical protein